MTDPHELIQAILDFFEAGDGAGFVLVTARCAGGGDGADSIVADIDWHAALPGNKLRIENDGIKAGGPCRLCGG